MKAVAFTGYRPEKLGFRESADDNMYLKFRSLQKRVINRLVELGYTDFISGMARGFDMWVAEDVCELKKENSEVKLISAIPFDRQASSWTDEEKERYEKIKTQADEIVVTSPSYTKGCFHKRNRYMVDNADVVVCCFDGKPGGTAYTVDYALKKDKVVIQIDPEKLVVSIISERKI
ncbi:MAG: DUF1273 domain-containing protein [Ruminococcaceae bacterium]|nr:DUF1273 domain-containing protein [Oscillospiraceae bacterium]